MAPRRTATHLSKTAALRVCSQPHKTRKPMIICFLSKFHIFTIHFNGPFENALAEIHISSYPTSIPRRCASLCTCRTTALHCFQPDGTDHAKRSRMKKGELKKFIQNTPAATASIYTAASSLLLLFLLLCNLVVARPPAFVTCAIGYCSYRPSLLFHIRNSHYYFLPERPLFIEPAIRQSL